MTTAQKNDHASLGETRAARRYFAKFDAITGHLARVAALMQSEGRLSKADVTVIGRYLIGLGLTFRALGHKYLFSGRDLAAGAMQIDRVDSGFPVFSELMEMANDAAQADRHLAGMATAPELKDQMVRTIVGDLEIPTRLQFAMSQRLYYEELKMGRLFWARNDPSVLWQGNISERRRQFLVHWAVYDSQVNLPTIYLMELEDTGRKALPKDERRWPSVQAHLMAQAMAHLKLVTIAHGFDTDFDDLHPKRLRRFHIGPLYSGAFTLQSGPIGEVLARAKAPHGEDWALAWTEEELLSSEVKTEKSGWFGTVEREVFALDPFNARGAETGATSTERSIILPQRVFQSLADMSPKGFADVRKFVVAKGGRVIGQR